MRTRAQGRGHRAEERAHDAAWHRVLFILPSARCLLPSLALAAPTQEEVLRSINQSVGESVDGAKLLAVFLAIVAAIVLIALLNYRQKRTVVPRVLNHPGKLLKEVAKSVNLKPAEIKQLKSLAEGQDLSSPLVLLLCPSILAKVARSRPERVDKKVLAALVRKTSVRL